MYGIKYLTTKTCSRNSVKYSSIKSFETFRSHCPSITSDIQLKDNLRRRVRYVPTYYNSCTRKLKVRNLLIVYVFHTLELIAHIYAMSFNNSAYLIRLEFCCFSTCFMYCCCNIYFKHVTKTCLSINILENKQWKQLRYYLITYIIFICNKNMSANKSEKD